MRMLVALVVLVFPACAPGPTIFEAILEGDEEQVRVLLAAGDVVNAPLHSSIEELRDGNRITLLGAGSTPLHAAAQDGNLALAKLLLDHGASLSIRDAYGHSPFHLAVVAGCQDLVALFLEEGVDPDQRVVLPEDSTIDASLKRYLPGQAALHKAAAAGQLQIAKLLLEQGAAVNVRSEAGMSPAHAAAAHARGEMLALLMERGADVDLPSLEGLTPLHLAASNGLEIVGHNRGRLETMRILLDAGADPGRRDKEGHTPEERARATGFEQGSDFLAAWRAGRSAEPANGT